MHAGKPGYLPLIPRVWGQLQRNLAHPALAGLARICADVLPAARRQTVWKGSTRPMPRPLMLFAAGFGTRMGALTADRPKPLIPVAGRPLIDHALALAEEAGAAPVVVNLHYRGEQIGRASGGAARRVCRGSVTRSWKPAAGCGGAAAAGRRAGVHAEHRCGLDRGESAGAA